MKQAKVLLDYAEGTLESTPLMRQLLDSRTADTLTLTTGIALEVRSASFRRIRGVTCVAVLADACAFWLSDESANPDVEILNAARPGIEERQKQHAPLYVHFVHYAKKWNEGRSSFVPVMGIVFVCVLMTLALLGAGMFDTREKSTTQSDSQAPAITQPSTQAPATGETKTP